MIYNYHTHTYRCHHATGEEEEYIKRAIENGVKYMGFSDHIPLKFPNGNESYYRVPVCEGKDYCDSIKKLREKYKDQIEISIGFEMEFYPKYFDIMLKNAIEYGGEYLILGQHFDVSEDTFGVHVLKEINDVNVLKRYVDAVIMGMRKKVFTYVAHPDLVNFTGDIEIYREENRKICVAARELNIPLEINLLGVRENRCYPNEIFWEMAGEEKSPVTFGFDSHDVMAAYDGESLQKANELVKNYSLNYIGKPELIPIKQLSLFE